jgi:hypothetical protein
MESIPATYKFLNGLPSVSNIGGSTTKTLPLADGIPLTVFPKALSEL